MLENIQGKWLMGEVTSTVENQGTEKKQKGSRSNPEEDREKAWFNG